MTRPLLVMIPTRMRRDKCEQSLRSFKETADDADLVFITDADDDSYEGMDWDIATNAVLDMGMRVGTTAKVNAVSEAAIDDYDAFMFMGDDHLFSTPHWDTLLRQEIEIMGGTGMVYGDDKRRTDIPETILITADIVRELGHFAEPSLMHYYIDNCWAELGGRSGLLHFRPDVIFEHRHYQMFPDVARDETYRSAEELWGTSDRIAFETWMQDVMQFEVAQLRRAFSRDIQWLFGRF